MVAQHQDAVVADVPHQPLAFLGAHRDAFEIVIADQPGEEAGVEVGRRQPFLAAAHRHRVGRVRVDDRVRPRQVLVEHRMLGEAGQVDRIRAAAQLVALAVDLDQVAGRDF